MHMTVTALTSGRARFPHRQLENDYSYDHGVEPEASRIRILAVMVLNTLNKLDLAVFGLTVVWFLAIWLVRGNSSSKRQLPPGPRPLPLVGNVFQVPKEKDYILYAEWAKLYGELAT